MVLLNAKQMKIWYKIRCWLCGCRDTIVYGEDVECPYKIVFRTKNGKVIYPENDMPNSEEPQFVS